MTIHRLLCSDFSPFRSPIKEKEKQWRINGLTMAQWINLNQSNRYVLAYRYSVLWKKLALSSHQWVLRQASRQSGKQPVRQAGRQADRWAGGWVGRQAGRQADIIWVDFEIFKTLYIQIKLFRFLFCLILLQCYYSVRTAFQLAFIK